MLTQTRKAGKRTRAKALTSSRTTGASRLIRAIEQNNGHGFKVLLKSGADVNATDKRRNSALSCAVYWNRTGMTKELVQRGAFARRYLAGAVFHGNLELVKLLIKKGASVGCIFRKRFAWEKFPNGSTLLGFAMQRVGPAYPRKIIELLIAAGANVDKPSPWFVPWANNDKEGIKYRHVSPLQIAAIRGMEDVMNLLWKAGATGTLKEV